LNHGGQKPAREWFQHSVSEMPTATYASIARVFSPTMFHSRDTAFRQRSAAQSSTVRSRDDVSIFLPSRAGGYLPRDLRKSIRLSTARMPHRSISPASVHFGLQPCSSSFVRMINHSPRPPLRPHYNLQCPENNVSRLHKAKSKKSKAVPVTDRGGL
jgi:hypothetical protein